MNPFLNPFDDTSLCDLDYGEPVQDGSGISFEHDEVPAAGEGEAAPSSTNVAKNNPFAPSLSPDAGIGGGGFVVPLERPPPSPANPFGVPSTTNPFGGMQANSDSEDCRMHLRANFESRTKGANSAPPQQTTGGGSAAAAAIASRAAATRSEKEKPERRAVPVIRAGVFVRPRDDSRGRNRERPRSRSRSRNRSARDRSRDRSRDRRRNRSRSRDRADSRKRGAASAAAGAGAATGPRHNKWDSSFTDPAIAKEAAAAAKRAQLEGAKAGAGSVGGPKTVSGYEGKSSAGAVIAAKFAANQVAQHNTATCAASSGAASSSSSAAAAATTAAVVNKKRPAPDIFHAGKQREHAAESGPEAAEKYEQGQKEREESLLAGNDQRYLDAVEAKRRKMTKMSAKGKNLGEPVGRVTDYGQPTLTNPAFMFMTHHELVQYERQMMDPAASKSMSKSQRKQLKKQGMDAIHPLTRDVDVSFYKSFSEKELQVELVALIAAYIDDKGGAVKACELPHPRIQAVQYLIKDPNYKKKLVTICQAHPKYFRMCASWADPLTGNKLGQWVATRLGVRRHLVVPKEDRFIGGVTAKQHKKQQTDQAEHALKENAEQLGLEEIRKIGNHGMFMRDRATGGHYFMANQWYACLMPGCCRVFSSWHSCVCHMVGDGAATGVMEKKKSAKQKHIDRYKDVPIPVNQQKACGLFDPGVVEKWEQSCDLGRETVYESVKLARTFGVVDKDKKVKLPTVEECVESVWELIDRLTQEPGFSWDREAAMLKAGEPFWGAVGKVNLRMLKVRLGQAQAAGKFDVERIQRDRDREALGGEEEAEDLEAAEQARRLFPNLDLDNLSDMEDDEEEENTVGKKGGGKNKNQQPVQNEDDDSTLCHGQQESRDHGKKNSKYAVKESEFARIARLPDLTQPIWRTDRQGHRWDATCLNTKKKTRLGIKITADDHRRQRDTDVACALGKEVLKTTMYMRAKEHVAGQSFGLEFEQLGYGGTWEAFWEEHFASKFVQAAVGKEGEGQKHVMKEAMMSKKEKKKAAASKGKQKKTTPPKETETEIQLQEGIQVGVGADPSTQWEQPELRRLPVLSGASGDDVNVFFSGNFEPLFEGPSVLPPPGGQGKKAVDYSAFRAAPQNVAPLAEVSWPSVDEISKPPAATSWNAKPITWQQYGNLPGAKAPKAAKHVLPPPAGAKNSGSTAAASLQMQRQTPALTNDGKNGQHPDLQGVNMPKLVAELTFNVEFNKANPQKATKFTPVPNRPKVILKLLAELTGVPEDDLDGVAPSYAAELLHMVDENFTKIENPCEGLGDGFCAQKTYGLLKRFLPPAEKRLSQSPRSPALQSGGASSLGILRRNVIPTAEELGVKVLSSWVDAGPGTSSAAAAATTTHSRPVLPPSRGGAAGCLGTSSTQRGPSAYAAVNGNASASANTNSGKGAVATLRFNARYNFQNSTAAAHMPKQTVLANKPEVLRKVVSDLTGIPEDALVDSGGGDASSICVARVAELLHVIDEEDFLPIECNRIGCDHTKTDAFVESFLEKL